MRRLMKSVLILSAIAFTLICTVSVQANDDSTRYKLVWSDEFVGESLNLDNWQYDIGGWGWGNNEAEYYTDREDNVKVEGGHLVITARADNYQYVDKEANGVTKTAPYTSGRINTSGKFSVKYGKIEARIQIPASRGMWPAFWMLGQNEPKGWPYCGEIDILETWNEQNFAQGTVHWEDEINKPNKDTYKYGKFFKIENKTQWIVYGINWTPEHIQWTIDGQVYYTKTITSESMTEIHKEFYILLNCAIGGNLAYYLPEENFVSDEMVVDYVRVYQRDCDNGTMTGTWAKQDKEAVESHTVKFKNQGKVLSTQIVLDRETVVVPEVKRKGYQFVGWFYKDQEITPDSQIESDMVIKAKWVKIKVGKAEVTKAKSKYKRAVTINFKAKKMVQGYQVKIGNKKEFCKKKKTTIGRLKSGKTYKVKVRAYYIDSIGKKVYGKWSESVEVTIK